jgi:hypothetical protein
MATILRKNLTDADIKSAMKDVTERCELSDTQAVGLRLRLSPKGGAVWQLAAKDTHGKARRVGLGDYPQVGLKQAREKARLLKARMDDGYDPVEDARQRRAWGLGAAEGVQTLGVLLEAYGIGPKGTQKSWPSANYRIRNVFARHIDQPVKTLTKKMLQATAQGHRGRYSASAAVRALRPVLKWASLHHDVDVDLAGIVPPASVQRRKRVLLPDELAILVPALRGGGAHERAMMFMLLTLARREEVGGAALAGR